VSPSELQSVVWPHVINASVRLPGNNRAQTHALIRHPDTMGPIHSRHRAELFYPAPGDTVVAFPGAPLASPVQLWPMECTLRQWRRSVLDIHGPRTPKPTRSYKTSQILRRLRNRYCGSLWHPKDVSKALSRTRVEQALPPLRETERVNTCCAKHAHVSRTVYSTPKFIDVA
jgi:hypothetical protein